MNLFAQDAGSPRRTAIDRLRFTIVGIAASIMIVLLITMSAFISSKVREFSFARSDSLTWNVSQVEVDFRRFQVALAQSIIQSSPSIALSKADLSQTTQSFDLFYARIDVILSTSKSYSYDPTLIDDIEKIVQFRDTLVEDIDRPDTKFQSDLKRWMQVSADIENTIRGVVTRSLQDAAVRQEDARASLHSALERYLIISLAVLFFACATIAIMMYLQRQIFRKSEQQKRISSFLNNVLTASQDVIFILNSDYCVIELNPAALRFLDSARDDVVGASILESFTPKRLQSSFQEALDSILNQPSNSRNGVVRKQVWARKTAKKLVPGELTMVRDVGLNGEPILIGFFRDTSRELNALRITRRALGAARRDAAAKSLFLATMSHEMRTPLHSVIAALDIIDAEPLSAATNAYIAQAKLASETALAQTNNVLDITKDKAQNSHKDVSAYKPKEIIQNICTQVDALAQKRQTKITFTWSGPETNYGTPKLVLKAMYNLVSNALKFTESGVITIKGENAMSEGRLITRFEVTDTGIGIKEHLFSSIFEDFYSDTSNGDGTLPGTGLGLGIVKRSVEAMGGTYGFSSQEGVGSTFWISFPSQITGTQLNDGAETLKIDKEPPVESPQGDVAAPKSLTILVVEDHAMNRQFLQIMLERMGHHVETAKDGYEGVQSAYQTAFDLVLTDINMPQIDGRNSAVCMRLCGKSKHACIIAVTAQTTMENEETLDIFADGIDGIITKPFTQTQLKDRISEILQERNEALEDHPQTEQPQHPQQELIDIGMDPAEIADMLDEAVTDAQTLQAKLQPALTDPQGVDWTKLASEAHYAAGGLFALGVHEMGSVLIAIEVAINASNERRLQGLMWLLAAEIAAQKSLERVS